jgi:DNA-directed RNA polymerase II subunit RPB4
MLSNTLTYLDHFARFTQKENVEAVERLLSAHKDLEKFERAQLGTGISLSSLQQQHPN